MSYLLFVSAAFQVVVFVDDITMPSVEEYGAQPPIELLRQFQDFKGFYDREKLFWKDIENTVLVAASAPPGGGRNPITKRLSRHFHMLCLPPSTDIVLKHIFGSIFSGFLRSKPFVDEIKALADKVTVATVEVRFIRVSDGSLGSGVLDMPAHSRSA
jgi:dynein heavy chain